MSQPEKLASQGSKPIINDEEDPDVSEPGIESDLESLIGDDEIPAHANPEEEDHIHEMIREQLGGMAIRKRRHDDVDQKFDNPPILDPRKSSRDASTSDLNLVVEALTPSRGIKLVKNGDFDEEGRSKRVRSGTGR